MSSANIQGWYYVKLTLKSLFDGTTTKVFNLSNRPLIDEADGATVYWPILKSISNIGTDSGDFLPLPLSGEIVIDDSPDSFGYERKFSDQLEKYTLIGGVVQVYSANTTLDDVSITGDFTLDWTTFVTGGTRTGNDFRIDVSEVGLSTRVMTKVVDQTTFPSAPTKSIGKFLPLPMGEGEYLQGILTVDSTSAPEFAYCTTLSTDLVDNTTFSGIYLKNLSGNYIFVSSPVATNTAIYQGSGATAGTANLIGIENAFKINYTSSDLSYLIRGGVITMLGNTIGGAASGKMYIKIYSHDPNTGGPTTTVIAQGAIDKADYSASWVGAAVEFDVEFSLDKAIVVDKTVPLWVGLSGEIETGASDSYLHTFNKAGDYMWDRSASIWQRFDFGGTPADKAGLKCKFYGVVLTPTNGSSAAGSVDGLGYSKIAFSQKTAAVSQTNPALNTQEPIMYVTGLADASNILGGGVLSYISKPSSVIKLLDLQWNGTNWTTTGAKIDLTRFASSFTGNFVTRLDASSTYIYPRSIRGYFDGRRMVSEMMSEVCQNSGARIVRYNGATQQFSLYAWGSRPATAKVISDEDAKIISIKRLGYETIVNRVILNIDRSGLATVLSSFQLNTNNRYVRAHIYDKNTSAYFSNICAISNSLFGVNELKNSTFNLISSNTASGYDSSFVQALAEFYLRTNQLPAIYCEIEVPLYKYKSLETMDVIEICHPSLPAYWGTSSNAHLPYYLTGTDDLLQGYYWKRFQRVRAQIEGKVLNYNLGEFPTMRLNCKLLLNPDDPT